MLTPAATAWSAAVRITWDQYSSWPRLIRHLWLVSSAGLLVQVDVRRVGDVEPEALGQEEERELVPDEVGRAPGRPVVRAVERHHPRARRRRAGADVEGTPAPRVVGLRRGDRVDHAERSVAGVVTHDQRHVAVGTLVEIAHHLEEVVTRRPVRRDGHRERRLPVALDHERGGRHRRGRLRLSRQCRRRPDQPAARAPVIPGAVELDVVRERPGVDVQRHLLALGRADVVAVGVEHAGVGHHPVERPGARVLLHHPVGDGDGDPAREGDRVDPRRPGRPPRARGAPCLSGRALLLVPQCGRTNGKGARVHARRPQKAPAIDGRPAFHRLLGWHLRDNGIIRDIGITRHRATIPSGSRRELDGSPAN